LLASALHHRLVDIGRQARQRRRRLQFVGASRPARCSFRARDQVGLRRAQVAARKRQAAGRLGNVGAGQVADLEPVAGRLEVDFENVDVVGDSPTIASPRITSM
jgi:predicted short-subunit dehydrogenase-like oxidoreductase (DUF2520 family)